MKKSRAKIGLLCSKNDNKLLVSEDILKAIWFAGGVGIALPYLKDQSTDRSERVAYANAINGALPYSISRNTDETTCITKAARNVEAFSNSDKASKLADALDIADEVFSGTGRIFDGADEALGVADKASGGADEVLGGADEALGGADEALGGADKAFGGADKAFGGADETLGGADEVLGGADIALGGADEASGDADEVLGGADEASGGTDKALGGADEVLGGADEALGGADEASGGADKALGVADEALGVADKALGGADEVLGGVYKTTSGANKAFDTDKAAGDNEVLGDIDEHLDFFDGFLFCGGGDIHPKYYGGDCHFDSSSICSERDEFEELVFNKVYFSGKPILGICRGMQVMNVFLGGSLHQNIEGHSQRLSREKKSHYVTLNDHGFLVSVVNNNSLEVNSFHHQCVKDLGRGLICDAISDDGHIEAFFSAEHSFCIGVQWHPECSFFNDEPSRKIFKAFIDACAKQN